jgi:hypothetical protein
MGIIIGILLRESQLSLKPQFSVPTAIAVGFVKS